MTIPFLAPASSRFIFQNLHLDKAILNISSPGFSTTQNVISYCKSHMQMTKQSPRLHETHGFERRIHQSTLQKRCAVEQSSFANANSISSDSLLKERIAKTSNLHKSKHNFLQRQRKQEQQQQQLTENQQHSQKYRLQY